MSTEVNTAMKVRTIKRHLREGVRNIFRNGWMSVASIGAVTVTLILVAAFLAIILNLNHMADKVEDDVVIKVLIDVTADDAQIQSLGDQIRNIKQVDTINFSSKDDELKELIESMGEEGRFWKMFQQDNPLNHAYIVKAKNPEDTVKVVNQIKHMQYIDDVVYGKEVVKRLFQFNKYARIVGLVLIIGLIFTAMFLISNTIKLTIMARSKEIGIMKLVGATNGFIRWPFFVEGTLLGILGAIIPVTILLATYHFIEVNLAMKMATIRFMQMLPYNPFAWQLSIVIVLIGALIGMWGSVMSVRKFLKV